ncbi:MAG: TraB/GumN family protein, partial [Ketobacteraceae bacterium]|nr:TraB/GumN family protein [Ketobacteraceae bacterium]
MGRINTHGKAHLPEKARRQQWHSEWRLQRCCAFFVVWLAMAFPLLPAQATAKEIRQYPSRLWQVSMPEAPSVKPSYLLGTMHLSDPTIVNLPPHIEQVVKSAASYTMEVKLDGNSYKTLANLSVLKGPKTLSDLVGPDTFDQLVSVLKSRGLNRYGLERMKPWVVG